MTLFRDLRRRLLGSSGAHPAPVVSEVEAKIFRGRERIVEIVGEASYEREIAQLAGPKTEHGVNVYMTARLDPEPTNRHDSNAVAVRIGGLLVGHLSRDQAPRFHSAMGDAGYAGSALVGIRARIHGGWKRPGGDEGHYGVTLLLPQSIAEKIGFGRKDL